VVRRPTGTAQIYSVGDVKASGWEPVRARALVLYDARNPAFQADGEADRQ
jgi:hypothetical protein